jgi:uncharacterized protein with PQ loop repeat
MQTWWLTALGLAAGLCTSLSFVPQVLKAWREGDTAAISKRMYVASLIAYGLWIVCGSVRLLAATATRVQAPTARDLGAANRERWRGLRQRLERGRRARTLRTRFRHDPAAYLAALEQQACQLALPS